MRNIREVLRLGPEHGMKLRDVAAARGIACTTVIDTGCRAKAGK
jgi:hypothetical protein